MNSLCLLLGSNLGNRLLNISKAIVLINKYIGEITNRSSIYETDSWGFKSEEKFINIALICITDLKPAEILDKIHQIEDGLERKRTGQGYESRSIDIDIIFYNKLIMIHEMF